MIENNLKILTSIEDIVGEFSDFIDKIIPSSFVPVLVQLFVTIVLFAVIAKFVFKPVRKILKARQEYVENQIKEAEEASKNSKEYEITAKNSIDEAKEKSRVIIADAVKKVEIIKEKANVELDEEIKAKRARAQQEIEQDKIAANEEIRKQIIDVALLASETILNREVNEDDSKKIIEDFVKDSVK